MPKFSRGKVFSCFRDKQRGFGTAECPGVFIYFPGLGQPQQ